MVTAELFGRSVLFAALENLLEVFSLLFCTSPPHSRAVNWIPRGSKVGLKKKDTSDVSYLSSSKAQDAF